MGWRGGVVATREAPSPSGVVVTYDSASVAEARAVIAHGIERRVPVLTLTGKVGAGTTAVLRSLYQRFGEQCDLALPAEPPRSISELTVPVLRLLGRPFIDAPGPELLASVRAALDVRAASPRPLALLLDDADALPDEVLEALGEFGSPEGSDRARLPIVLAGRPGLLARLSGRRLAALRRGLTIDVRLHTPAPARPLAPSPPRPAPPRRAGRPRTIVLASLVGCLCGASALYVDQISASARLAPPVARLPAVRSAPSGLGPLLAPPAGTAVATARTDSPAAFARRVVEKFQRAVAAGDAETLRSVLAANVSYNGVVGVDAALDDQLWLGRGHERPRFLPPDAAYPVDGGVRVEGRFAVSFRDVAGMRGEVMGQAVWLVTATEGAAKIVSVDYDILPTPGSPPLDG